MTGSFRVGLASLAAAALGMPPAAAAPGDDAYARPGQIVATPDGARINLYCTGAGSPTVVFDAGHQDWAAAWAAVQPAVAQWTRACAYDRPGSGFSGPGPVPRTSGRIAEELHGALRAAGVPGPYILVGHSFGGYNMRAFAYRYMAEVAGMVLVDSDVGDFEPADMRDDIHRYFIRQGAELQACRDAVAKADPRVADPASPGPPALACDQRFFRGFPEAVWSPQLNAALLRVARTDVALYDAVIAELHAMPGDEADLRRLRRPFGARPIRILTASQHYADTARTPAAVHLKHLRFEDEIARSQANFLMLSSNATQVFAYHSRGAYIQFDEPDLVVVAIREVFDQSRTARTRGHS